MKNIDAMSLDALLASGRVEEAVAGLLQASHDAPTEVWPLRRLSKVLTALGQLTEARATLQRALEIAPNDLDTLWGAYELEQIRGNVEEALRMQNRALALAPVVTCETLLRSPPGRSLAPLGKRCKVLMLCVPGTYQANNPLEYIVDGESIELYKWFVRSDEVPELPDYDVIFNAIGYAHGVEDALLLAERFIADQDKPVINEPAFVALTSRAAVTQRFADSRHVTAAPTVRMSREAVEKLQIHSPILLRPLNSQAGSNFCKICLMRSL